MSEWKKNLGISAHMKDVEIEKIALYAKEYGCNYMEIIAEEIWGLPGTPSSDLWIKLKCFLKHLDIEPLLHASYIELNMASLRKYLREAAVKQSILCLELAAYLDCAYMVVHPGNLNKNYPAHLIEKARDYLVESLKELSLVAEEKGIVIALENGWNGDNFPIIDGPKMHLSLIERVGSPMLKAILDIGHAHTFDLDLLYYMEYLKDKIVGIHLHDNNGKKDEHLPIGEGKIPVTVIERVFQIGVPVIIEMNSLEDLKKSMVYLGNLFLS